MFAWCHERRTEPSPPGQTAVTRPPSATLAYAKVPKNSAGLTSSRLERMKAGPASTDGQQRQRGKGVAWHPESNVSVMLWAWAG